MNAPRIIVQVAYCSIDGCRCEQTDPQTRVRQVGVIVDGQRCGLCNHPLMWHLLRPRVLATASSDEAFLHSIGISSEQAAGAVWS